jgi:Domain of unknown function (DUF5919)
MAVFLHPTVAVVEVALRGVLGCNSIGCVRSGGRVKRFAIRVVSDEYLDLYLLAFAALTFTILGFVGIADIKVLASVILALLAILAFSQIRSRRHVADIAAGQRFDPLSIFQTGFPGDLETRRGSASSLLLIGMTMTRTVQGGSLTVLRQVLRSGGKIRVLLTDPTDDALMRAASEHSQRGITADRFKRRVESTLEELAMLQDATSGDLEIRVAPFIPHMGINAIDVGNPDGLIVLQHYEHRSAGESAPVISLKPADGFWYEHFAAEAERLWQDGTPWPLAPAVAVRRSSRPSFKAEFGPELERSMDKAQELLITGVTRNTLITSSYHKFEDRLRNGCRIRMLLMEPASDAIVVAAERYYADRTPDSIRERVRHTLRLLAELERSAGGDLAVRLTSHPLAMGTIAVDGGPDLRSDASALFVEYYTYQAAGEPKFVLQPADSQWFDNLYQEAEALWDNATVHNLTP